MSTQSLTITEQTGQGDLETFSVDFDRIFSTASPDDFGSTYTSPLAFNILFKAIKTIKRDPDYSEDRLIVMLAEHLAAQVGVSNIGGKPVLDFSRLIPEISAEQLAMAAIMHACVVAPDLVQKRIALAGTEVALANAISTFVSYSLKDAFDRWMRYQLLALRGSKDELISTFFSVPKRDLGFPVIATVDYPAQIPINGIWGVSKPTRYLPAQAAKNAILRWLETDAKPDSPYFIVWADLFQEVILEARDDLDLAIRIAVRLVNHLLSRGVDVQEAFAFITSGYDPAGPFKEHGDAVQTQLFSMWDGIILSLEASNVPAVSGLYPLVRSRFATVKLEYNCPNEEA